VLILYYISFSTPNSELISKKLFVRIYSALALKSIERKLKTVTKLKFKLQIIQKKKRIKESVSQRIFKTKAGIEAKFLFDLIL
jgi:hypothetical protein